jgi:putative CocE/NonD family hydrolase
MIRRLCLPLLVLALLAAPGRGQEPKDLAAYIRQHYSRSDHLIPMRDGVRLYTVVYAPKNKDQTYPILLNRTPYGVGPYDKDKFRKSLGPNPLFVKEGYIFVYQDVRGRYMSEGVFVNMRPELDRHPTPKDTDESTDTYDTISWLLRHVPGHNGKVGQYGISYPGFYTSCGMINAHPALKAASPQAPIADWFFEDFHHQGAFFLPHAFNFFAVFGQPRPKPTPKGAPPFKHGTPDGYQFFLDLGPLGNANARYFHHRIAFWDEIAEHPNYDVFWQARNLLPHLHKVAPAVMTVGGWFDAENLYGALKTYAAVEKQNPGIFNVLVMGPWRHGGWATKDGDRLGNIYFGSRTAAFFQEKIELPFFNHFLKGKGEHGLPEAYLFETGANRWRKFDRWPPAGLQEKTLYLHSGGRLAFEPPAGQGEDHDEYVSDPTRPVPYTENVTTRMDPTYMTADQRYAARRTDVLTYQTHVLKKSLTLAGPLVADLWVSTSGTDSDWVVKVIDVFPSDAKDYPGMTPGQHLGGYQMLVRSEVIRGRFRKSFRKPEPFVPNQPTRVRVQLQDVLHTFAKGHRIMVQLSSTWFPLVDRNPQKYVDNIFHAEAKDFISATQRVYHSVGQPTCLRVGVLPAETGPADATH